MRKIEFIQKHRPFNAGEIAGYNDKPAARLVAGGVARYVDEPVKSVKSDPEPPAAAQTYETRDMTPKRRGRPPKGMR